LSGLSTLVPERRRMTRLMVMVMGDCDGDGDCDDEGDRSSTTFGIVSQGRQGCARLIAMTSDRPQGERHLPSTPPALHLDATCLGPRRHLPLTFCAHGPLETTFLLSVATQSSRKAGCRSFRLVTDHLCSPSSIPSPMAHLFDSVHSYGALEEVYSVVRFPAVYAVVIPPS
jgi:hypothetical protein